MLSMKTLNRLALPLALALGLSACATPFKADVSRFAVPLPAPQGQTFAVVAEDPKLAGGLEFAGVGGAFGPWGPWGGWGGGFGGWGFGFNDPFFGGPDVRSYTIYTSGVDVKIDRRADGQRLFEGKAEAVSRSNRLPRLVPNLVDALFTDFPGNSGETVRITIRDDEKTVRPTD